MNLENQGYLAVSKTKLSRLINWKAHSQLMQNFACMSVKMFVCPSPIQTTENPTLYSELRRTIDYTISSTFGTGPLVPHMPSASQPNVQNPQTLAIFTFFTIFAKLHYEVCHFLGQKMVTTPIFAFDKMWQSRHISRSFTTAFLPDYTIKLIFLRIIYLLKIVSHLSECIRCLNEFECPSKRW